ncbi:hypothetical protein GCM10027079_26150 [Sediminivirga luteola]
MATLRRTAVAESLRRLLPIMGPIVPDARERGPQRTASCNGLGTAADGSAWASRP